MGMPVKLSDDLVQSARLEAAATDRSITAQIEHWAKLGRAVETALRHADVLALKRSNGDLLKSFSDPSERETVHALLERIATTTDRSAVLEKLRARGKPVYATDPRYPSMIVRIDPDGGRIPGHFVDRHFVPAAEA
jgi:hypothetical protein